MPNPIPEDVLAAFDAEALYARDAWFVDRVLDLDPEARTITAQMDTTALPMVEAQRVVPGHPPHVPAAVVIQASGTLGHLFAVFALDLRPSQGWVGFGTHIHQARFGRIGEVGPPLDLHATCTRARRIAGTWFCDFAYAFDQRGERVYTSRQTAAWRRVDDSVGAVGA